jgi:hypothetical protein
VLARAADRDVGNRHARGGIRSLARGLGPRL